MRTFTHPQIMGLCDTEKYCVFFKLIPLVKGIKGYTSLLKMLKARLFFMSVFFYLIIFNDDVFFRKKYKI